MKKVLIIGSGLSPTGRGLWLSNALMAAGIAIEYLSLDAKVQGEKIHEVVMDMEYSDLEARFENTLVYGNSHPEIFSGSIGDLHAMNFRAMEPMKEPTPDQRKGPKGPRNRWGKIR